MDDEQFEKLREGLQIDKHGLDDALLGAAQQFQEISEAHTYAVSVRDKLKEDLETLDARNDLEIRADLAANDMKITEGVVTALVKTHPDRAASVYQLQEAKTVVNSLAGLKESFTQRSYALSNLTELYTSGYFAMDATISRKRKHH